MDTDQVKAVEPVTEPREEPDIKVRIKPETVIRASWIFRYLAPYRLRFLSGVATLMISSSLGLCFPYLTGLLLDGSIAQPAAPANSAKWMSNINVIAVVLLGTLTLQAILSFFSTYWFYQCGESALVDLRRETFRKLIGQPMSFFAQRRVGELYSRPTTDITLIQDTLTTTIQHFDGKAC